MKIFYFILYSVSARRQYVPKQAEIISYTITSEISDFVVQQEYKCMAHKEIQVDYQLGANWYTDKADPALYDGKIQGGQTVFK